MIWVIVVILDVCVYRCIFCLNMEMVMSMCVDEKYVGCILYMKDVVDVHDMFEIGLCVCDQTLWGTITKDQQNSWKHCRI